MNFATHKKGPYYNQFDFDVWANNSSKAKLPFKYVRSF